jgi:hypothetical protein
MTEYNAGKCLISRHRGIFKSSAPACSLETRKLSQRFESHDHLITVCSALYSYESDITAVQVLPVCTYQTREICLWVVLLCFGCMQSVYMAQT